MEDNQLERVQSYQYPRAHYGHLNASQNSALESFRSLCQEQDYYKPAGPGGKPAASHDDETLLRYLRARKFIPKDALEQFKDTENWRKENKLDELYDTIDIDDYEETRRLYPQWTGRRDKRGIPVYVFEVAYLNSKTMAKYEKSIAKVQSSKTVSAKLIRLFALYENLVRFVLPLCSVVPNRPYPETPVSQSNNIVDISRVGLKQFWNLKAHMQDASTLATAHYPETLDRIFIIGAPSFFPTVWSWIKRWFDPITVSKIFILSAQDMQSTLEQYIDPSNIPMKYGGQLDWSWGDKPVLEPAIQDALKWTAPEEQKGQNTFPIGPIKWEESENGALTALAVGNSGGSPRNLVLATVTKPSKPSKLTLPTSQDPFLSGPLSTTGTHTHPAEGAYFPSTGDTPPPEADDDSLGAKSPPASAADAKSPPASIADASTQNVTSLPIRPAESESSKLSSPHVTREGTSKSRLEQQDETLAQGQLANGTPDIVDLGHGDKTTTVETSTVGQAPKDISVPEALPTEDAKDTSYLGQAKAAASSVYSTAASTVGVVTTTVASAVGMGQKETEEEPKAPEPQPEDPRVDKLSTEQIEDYMRNQQASLKTEKKGEDAQAQ